MIRGSLVVLVSPPKKIKNELSYLSQILFFYVSGGFTKYTIPHISIFPFHFLEGFTHHLRWCSDSGAKPYVYAGNVGEPCVNHRSIPNPPKAPVKGG